jgi:hypothetical protein
MNNNKNPSWICPRCNSPAYPDSLARDLLTESLLKKLPKNVSEIEFKENHKNYLITKVDEPDSDDEDGEIIQVKGMGEDPKAEEEEETVKNEDDNIPPAAAVIVQQPPPSADIIDLISDDEDEEVDVVSAAAPNKRPRKE